ADARPHPVYDLQLLVRAVVESRQAVPPQTMIWLAPAARGAQPSPCSINRTQAADGIHHDRDPHARARAFGERVDELVADRAGPEDVALHVDCLAGRSDRREHGWVEGRTVREDLDSVALLERRLTRRLEEVDEMIAAAVHVGLEVIRDGRRKERDEDQPRDERAAEDRQVEHAVIA